MEGYDDNGDPLMQGVVTSIGTAVGTSLSGDATLGDRVQQAMERAVIEALAEGVSIFDSEEIIRRKHSARDRVEADYSRAASERMARVQP